MTALDSRQGSSASPDRTTLPERFRTLRSQGFPFISIITVSIVLLIPAVFAPWIAPYNPETGVLTARFLPPVGFGGTWEYPLGTDRVGRDVLSRIIFGARVSLTVSMVGIAAGAGLGATLGLIAGYFRGATDLIIMRAADMSFAIPGILFALALVTAVGANFWIVILVIVSTLWALYARQMRGVTLPIAKMDYVDRARVAGTSHVKILALHLLPNVKNTLIVLATLQVGYVIILEASLSFLGVGIPPPSPSWGRMVSDGREMIVAAWWVSFFPGLAIVLTVLSVNSFGDWLRDRLDPRLRQL